MTVGMITDYLITCTNDQSEDGEDDAGRDAGQSDFDSF